MFKRPFHRHPEPPHHHPVEPARRGLLGLIRVQLLTIGSLIMSSVTGTFTAPTTRKSGAALALTDINYFSLQRNGTEIQKLAPTGPVISWSDVTPTTGTDTYEVFTVTQDGFTSDPSNAAVVVVSTADPASAVTDLTATAVASTPPVTPAA
jgi:hypothetical protein